MSELTEQQIKLIQRLLTHGQEGEAALYLQEKLALNLDEAHQYLHQLRDTQSLYSPDTTAAPIRSALHPEYKAIHVYHVEQKIMVYTLDDQMVEVDESHPEWQYIVEQFGRGQIFKCKQTFIESIHQAENSLLTPTPSHSSLRRHPEQRSPGSEFYLIKAFLMTLFIGSIFTTWMLALFFIH